MISGVNNISWIDQNIELVPNSTPPPPSSWPNINTNTIIIDTNQNQNQNQSLHNNKDNEIDSLCSFKPILDIDDQDWYMSNNENNNIIIQSHHQDIITDFIDQDSNLLLNQVDLDYSSTSCSPTDVVFNTLHASQIPYFPPLLNDIDNNAFSFLEAQASSEAEALLGGFTDFTSNNDQITLPSLCPDPKIQTLGIPHVSEAVFGGFEEGLGKPMFVNRPKMLRPLESLPPSGAQPTLFQKRVALRKKLEENDKKKDCENMRMEEKEKKRKMSGVRWEEIVEDVSVDGCGLNYDSDELTESTMRVEESGNKSGVNGGDGGDRKGKKKGMPAKNLMAERRRRKKLNDRLYMLRSVVPKISKMDRASILGDAIEYLKELLQKINDINTELESTPPGSALSATAPSFHPLTPTPPALPARIKDELCPSSLPSPNCQPARIEVRLREGKAVNIHMFCARKPGILLSTMKALDNLGLDIHQAVISCFNGFAMDVFRAEQWNEVQEVPPEQIKAVLLESAGYHGTK